MSCQEFRSLRPIVLDLSVAVIRDVLMSDFGMVDEDAMSARNVFLAAKNTDKIYEIPVALHPSELAALIEWLDVPFTRDLGTASAARRLRRLFDHARSVGTDHLNHPWLNGLRINGSSASPLPAWHDAGMLYGFWHADTQPVILRPDVSKGPHGMNVSYFKMEVVSCPQ